MSESFIEATHGDTRLDGQIRRIDLLEQQIKEIWTVLGKLAKAFEYIPMPEPKSTSPCTCVFCAGPLRLHNQDGSEI